MKLTESKKNFITLTFLILLAFNNIAETNSLTKSLRSKSKRKNLIKSNSKSKTFTRTLTKFDVNTVITKVKTFLANLTPEDKIYLFLGFLNLILPFDLQGTVQKIQAKIQQFKKCQTQIKQTQADVEVAKGQLTANAANVKQNLEKKEYCEKTKKQLKEVYDNINTARSAEQSYLSMAWSAATAGFNYIAGFTPSQIEQYCHSFDQSKLAIFKKDFGTFENYDRQCRFFAGMDCNQYNFSYDNLKGFMEVAYGTVSSFAELGDCFGQLFDTELGLKQGLEDFVQKLKDLAAQLKTQVIYTLLNVITFGVWGAVKGAYYLVDLYFNVYNLVSENIQNGNVDHAIKIGYIIGEAVMAIKSFIFGRRRLMKRKLKK